MHICVQIKTEEFLNMKRSVMRFSLAAVLVLALFSVCTLSAAADTDDTLAFATEQSIPYAADNLIKDGGIYTVSNIGAGANITVKSETTEEGDKSGFALSNEVGASSLFEINAHPYGSYSISTLENSQKKYLCYDADADIGKQILLTDNGGNSFCEFDILYDGDSYVIKPHYAQDENIVLSLSVDANGQYSLCLSNTVSELSAWKIEQCAPESMSLSMYNVDVKPYTSYEDLRAIVTPSYMAEYVKWSSSDRNIVIVDNDGKFCALSEGEVTITASLGTYSLECKVNISSENTYAWFSQNNVSTGGWNGEPLYNIYFRSGGVKKRFAANNSTKSTDWLSEGCAICSIAQVLSNMGARYTNGYDFRSGIDGNILADPYTVALANTNNRGAESDREVLAGDPVFASHRAIAQRFNVDGKQVSVSIQYNVSKKAIKEALDENPWGVVVCFENSAYGKHYITFNECLNPDAENPKDYIFTVSDPASVNAYNADNVVFEQSYSYKRLYYRFSNATLMQIWGYES